MKPATQQLWGQAEKVRNASLVNSMSSGFLDRCSLATLARLARRKFSISTTIEQPPLMAAAASDPRFTGGNNVPHITVRQRTRYASLGDTSNGNETRDRHGPLSRFHGRMWPEPGRISDLGHAERSGRVRRRIALASCVPA